MKLFWVAITTLFFSTVLYAEETKISLEHPGENVHGTVQLFAKVETTEEIKSVTFFCQEKELGAAQLENEQWQLSWDTTQSTPGEVLIYAQVTTSTTSVSSEKITTVVTEPKTEENSTEDSSESAPEQDDTNTSENTNQTSTETNPSSNDSPVENTQTSPIPEETTSTSTPEVESTTATEEGTSEITSDNASENTSTEDTANSTESTEANTTESSETTNSGSPDTPLELEVSNFPKYIKHKLEFSFTLKGNLSQNLQKKLSCGDQILLTESIQQSTEQVSIATPNLQEGDTTVSLEILRGEEILQSKTFETIIDRTPPKILTADYPKEITIGVVELEISLEDLSGLSSSKEPKISLQVGEQVYPFRYKGVSENKLQAQILINSDFPEGKASIFVENLEDLAGNQIASKHSLGEIQIGETATGNWPIAPRNYAHPILPVVTAHVAEDKSGLWIQVTSGKKVHAVADGRIVEVQNTKQASYLRIQELRSSGTWGYHHFHIANNPNTDRPWNVGDIVKSEDILGEVTSLNEESFVYLEYGTFEEGLWKNTNSPLDYLTPKTKNLTDNYAVLQDATNFKSPHINYEVPATVHQAQQQAKGNSFTDMLLLVYGIAFACIFLFILMTSKAPQYK